VLEKHGHCRHKYRREECEAGGEPISERMTPERRAQAGSNALTIYNGRRATCPGARGHGCGDESAREWWFKVLEVGIAILGNVKLSADSYSRLRGRPLQIIRMALADGRVSRKWKGAHTGQKSPALV